MTVNKANLRLWVQDLRTTDAPQAKLALRQPFGDGRISFCCLGRACEVAIANGVELTWDGRRRSYNDHSGDRSTFRNDVLPPAVIDWLGLPCDVENPVIGVDPLGEPLSAAVANDQMGWSFAQIADAVEAHFGLAVES